jgi:hypothetical protein
MREFARRLNRNKFWWLMAAVLLCVVPCGAQQIASIDLSLPADSKALDDHYKNLAQANGCKELPFGRVSDGIVMHPDSQPQKIELEILKLSDTKPRVGQELTAEVRLTNKSDRAFLIPWSTNIRVTTNVDDPKTEAWDMGSFQAVLKKGRSREIRLNSLSPPVYGAKYSRGSMLSIQPGEWITARIKFELLVAKDAEWDQLREGKSQLSVEWQQTGRTRAIHDCTMWSGFFPYRDYYSQQKLPVEIDVTRNPLNK